MIITTVATMADDIDQQIAVVLQHMNLDEKLNLCTGSGSWRTAAYPEKGVPSVLMSDGTNGIRRQKETAEQQPADFAEKTCSGGFDGEAALENTYVATCFPSGSSIACSWDTELLRNVARALAVECRSLGIQLLLGPGINIRRHPLTARNFEYYSEDPFLTGRLGAATVSELAANGIGSVIKHFACHHSDTHRTRVNEVVDERALREIYLAAFEYIVKTAKPIGVMSSYNKINGCYVSQNYRLLTEILRNEWGFTGMTVSDWGAVTDPEKATYAGLDLQMPESKASSSLLKQLVREGRLSEQFVNRRVGNILRAVFELERMRKIKPAKETVSHHELAREAAAGSIVLLKNETDVLPLSKKYRRIAVIGDLAKSPLYQGTGCAIIHTETVDSPWDCLNTGVSGTAELSFAPGYRPDGTTDDQLLMQASDCAGTAEIAIVFVGSFLPAESDSYNRTDMSIEPGHTRVLETVLAVGIPVIVVIQAGDAVEMPWIDRASAVIWSGFGGEGVGDALAGILLGKYSPSGKLSVSFPVSLTDTPAYTSFPGDGFTMCIGEGLFTGYRYYDYRNTEPLFPFGFGLSYTTFVYENLVLSSFSLAMPDPLTVTADIRNTGRYDAAEIVQLYLAPQSPSLPRPKRELKGFVKVFIKAGEKKTVTFYLEERDFACFDPSRRAWIVDSEKFTVELAASSRDIRLQATVLVLGQKKPPRILTAESGFPEIFEQPVCRDILFDFLVEQGIITRQEAGEALQCALEKTFWGLYSYLDMNTDGRISLAMVRQLVARMNEACGTLS